MRLRDHPALLIWCLCAGFYLFSISKCSKAEATTKHSLEKAKLMNDNINSMKSINTRIDALKIELEKKSSKIASQRNRIRSLQRALNLPLGTIETVDSSSIDVYCKSFDEEIIKPKTFFNTKWGKITAGFIATSAGMALGRTLFPKTKTKTETIIEDRIIYVPRPCQGDECNTNPGDGEPEGGI